ncbi:MAG: ACP S-malonyltransferase [Thermoguttaceae bacterium]|nr:ACP S-malonyltransferase [Thermoguttaceae bacterium]
MGKIAFLFPGQGAQTVGMGQEMLARPEVTGLFSRASEILGYDLADVCTNGPKEKLDSTAVCQPAIFTASCAALNCLKADQPEVVDMAAAAAGLSLGEYTALYFAGAFSFEDALRLVQKRGEAMQHAADSLAGGMVAILGLDAAVVERLCEEAAQGDVLKVANYLCPKNYSVSGTRDACERVAQMAEAAGAMRVVPLAVAGAFHTPMMASAAEALSSQLASTSVVSPKIPVISNVDVRSHSDPDDIRRTLLAQLTSSVRWEETVRALIADGFDRFYEVGPGRVLRGLMKRIDRKMPMEGVEF